MMQILIAGNDEGDNNKSKYEQPKKTYQRINPKKGGAYMIVGKDIQLDEIPNYLT